MRTLRTTATGGGVLAPLGGLVLRVRGLGCGAVMSNSTIIASEGDYEVVYFVHLDLNSTGPTRTRSTTP